MPRRFLAWIPSTLASLCLLATGVANAETVDKIIASENSARGVTTAPAAKIDDLAFLRRASVDLIGRIPTIDEIDEYLAWPEQERRKQLVEKLVQSDRFADRWTVFFGDMLRMRSNATGGAALTAYVHNAIENDLPYDELVRRLIATNGKANKTPEVGYILGDNADPFALASVTSQVFMGIRIGCAQCHDHPFDAWTRKDFYGIAAFFGKTRRVESNLTRVVYTTEGNRTAVLWPPEDEAEADRRKPMEPVFPFDLIDKSQKPRFIERFEAVIAARTRKNEPKETGPSVDDLLADAADKATSRTRGGSPSLDITGDAKKSLRKIDVKSSLYKNSELRSQLADLITSPRNTYFAESFVNRVWKELVGRGFVEPVDDFRADNLPSHPKALTHLAEEFVANGYDFRKLVTMVVLSDAYQRSNVSGNASALDQELLTSNFLATKMRRMLSESLYDSIVIAGHLFDHKHPDGANKRILRERVRVMVDPGKVVEGDDEPERGNLAGQFTGAGGSAMMKPMQMSGGGYALEDAIELDFNALLTKDDEVEVERMQVMSREELEAQRMMQERARRRAGAKYETRIVERTIDDNPKFNSAMRMAAPAPAGHFIRVFGQTPRTDLGEERARYPSMRQALMMLNGRLTHEASRVGPFEPIHALLTGPKKDLDAAVRYAYREILSRNASEQEIEEAKTILGDNPVAGMADLRWVLLNCNEFRFLP